MNSAAKSSTGVVKIKIPNKWKILLVQESKPQNPKNHNFILCSNMKHPHQQKMENKWSCWWWPNKPKTCTSTNNHFNIDSKNNLKTKKPNQTKPTKIHLKTHTPYKKKDKKNQLPSRHHIHQHHKHKKRRSNTKWKQKKKMGN